MRYVKRKNSGRRNAPKNRYVIGAKLSEHKFLRILRGYADGVMVQELARTTHVTERTIRDTYTSLRSGLRDVAIVHPERFGMAGTLLFDRSGGLTDVGEKFLEAVRNSRLFRYHKRRHAPRLQCAEKEEELIFELAVRFLCAIDLRHLQSAAGQRMALKLLTEAVPNHNPRRSLSEFSKPVPGARPVSHGAESLFEDLRGFLRENPL